MRIESNVVWSRLMGADATTLTALDEQFKVKVPGARFIPSVRAGWWDGYVRYFKPNSGAFMTGFIAEVLLALEDLGHPGVPVVRKYVVPPAHPLKTVQDFTPRDYQEQIVRDMLRVRRGVVKAATNAGKTEIAMMLCQRLGLPTLYVATEQTLWAQTYDRFVDRFGTHVVGKIGAGTWNPKLLTIAMVQSVAPKLSLFRGAKGATVFDRNMPEAPQVLIADEVHMFTGGKKRKQDEAFIRRGPKAQWALVLENVKAPYRFGMSGTPLTDVDTRDRNLVGLTGPMMSEVSNRDLVDMGYSAVPRITFVRYEGRHVKGDWQDAYRSVIVEGKARNEAIAELCWVHRGKQVLILAQWAEHARAIKRALNDADVACVFLSGRDNVFQRQKWLRAFANREIQAIVATTIFDQGVDVPAIDVLVMAGGGGVSPIKPLQRLGRGLRRRADKTEVLVYDFEDRYNEYLEEHTDHRMRLFKREKFPVSTMTVDQIKEAYRVQHS